MNNIVKTEVEQLAQKVQNFAEPLRGCALLVTGATGLVGSLCVRFALELNALYNLDLTVYSLVRSEEKAQRVFADLLDDQALKFVIADVSDPLPNALKVDYIIHAGCPTASQFFTQHPVETSLAIAGGTRNMLELAKASGSTSFVYISSMEVYGMGNSVRGIEPKLTEQDVGYVNPLSVRSCYPEAKRMAENLCVSYASEYAVPAKIIRLAQTFGPGIPLDDSRLFAMLARCAMQNQDIILRTTGESTRMYLYTTDALTAIYSVLLFGRSGEAYNAANENTYSSIKEMAGLVAGLAEAQIGVSIQVDPGAPFPPEHHLPLDTSKLKSLGWSPTVDLKQMYLNLVDYLKA